MSTAIATATAALRDMLRSQIVQIAPDLADLLVTTRAPDQARSAYTGPQLNLFLFDVPVNRTLRNFDRQKGYAEAISALGVTLHYLLTAYARGNNDDDGDLSAHHVLGAAMSVLHRSPVLDIAEIGPLHINRLDMTASEVTTLWSGFHTPYRLSAAYAVGGVTIRNTWSGLGPNWS